MSEDLPDRTSSERSDKLDEHLTLRVGEDLLEEVERLVEQGVYPNRSEAARELLSFAVDEVSEDKM